jgi:hypothetical protein
MALVPRVVVVTRPTEYELLLGRHGTYGQVRFFLESRGRDTDALVSRHDRLHAARGTVLAAIPTQWRRAAVPRGDLDRFLFEPEDIVVVVGQDGLVANAAKYLRGQLVVGINGDPGYEAGVLVTHGTERGVELMIACGEGQVSCVESRTMVSAKLDDGQELVALNEIFLGRRTHQSALYRIELRDETERHSSSGLIVSSGTGATGWASSIHRGLDCSFQLPTGSDNYLAFFVREAWESPVTGAQLVSGLLRDENKLRITSEMNDTGVLFGDGIEDDALRFGWGQTAWLGRADRTLQLVRS